MMFGEASLSASLEPGLDFLSVWMKGGMKSTKTWTGVTSLTLTGAASSCTVQ